MTNIKTVGICGAGVMGSQLAAFLASTSIRVYLFDLTQDLAERGIETASNVHPAAFYHKKFITNITLCNYKDHLDKLRECEWIVEAISERLDWKQDLYRKIHPHMNKKAVLSSNTSGLSLKDLTEGLEEDLLKRFLITHFFNPPRYMRLVELIAGEKTGENVLQNMTKFIEQSLGKGVVRAKDTPNFIANRIGVFGMMLTLKLARDMRFSVEQVDALTGPVMGRPKSATFRTADLIGLDTLAFVAKTSYEKCPDDEQRDLFLIPSLLSQLIDRKWLGQKTKRGFYRKEDRDILALDLETLEYNPRKKVRMDAIGVARRFTDIKKKLNALVYNPDEAGRFAWELTIGVLSYAAHRLEEISDDIIGIDRAVKWGFGWELGPFETWDSIGVLKSTKRMEAEGRPVPGAVRSLLESGKQSFYERDEKGKAHYFDIKSRAIRPASVEKDVIVLSDEKAQGKEILRNWSASLVDIGNGVGCVEFHSPLQPEFNPIDTAIMDMLQQSLIAVEKKGFKGLVISHEGTHFTVGANLAMILELARSRQFPLIEQLSKMFQEINQAIRYALFPVVAAPFSLCLGGGFELIAPCCRIVALAELYCGAVETGVGLIPGAGGSMRLLSHMSHRYPPQKFGPMFPAQKAFETIAFAKVSTSAHEAVELGYLREKDIIVLSKDRQIARAKDEVLKLSKDYIPPEPSEFILPGEGGRGAITVVVESYLKAGKISEHDALIAKKLAYVVTGGDRANGIDPVDEQYLLDIEREVFVSLTGEPKSQQRMAHMLKTGKPLRN
jgi:3-hydroxyacyl-CoA dehydrogenase